MDDFSFPNIAEEEDSTTLCQLPFPHFASSPLWFLSSVTANHHRLSLSSAEEDDIDNDDDDSKTVDKLKDDEKSSLLQTSSGRNMLTDEERMDMLWEDFNEELQAAESDADHHGTVELCCVQVLSGPTGGCGFLHHRRPSLLMMLKVLKRLVLMHKAGSSKNTPLC